jgi:hypothetical protein
MSGTSASSTGAATGSPTGVSSSFAFRRSPPPDTGHLRPRNQASAFPGEVFFFPKSRQRSAPNSTTSLAVVHGAFGFDRGAAFFLCSFATDLAPAAFARSRVALLAAPRLSADHGVY